MTAMDKRKLICELTHRITQGILDKVEDMPDDWDGLELRRFVADVFQTETAASRLKGKRLREYRDVCLDRNLL